MRISIKATSIELTPAIDGYVRSRMEALDRLVAGASDEVIRVEVGKISRHHQKGDVFRAEVNVPITGTVLRAVAEEEDLYAAIDAVRDEIMREVKSKKGKKETLFRRGARRVKNMLRFGRTRE